jgi:hypothetical protein
VVVGVVVVVVVAQEFFYVSPDLRMSELRKSGSVCIIYRYRHVPGYLIKSHIQGVLR